MKRSTCWSQPPSDPTANCATSPETSSSRSPKPHSTGQGIEAPLTGTTPPRPSPSAGGDRLRPGGRDNGPPGRLRLAAHIAPPCLVFAEWPICRDCDRQAVCGRLADPRHPSAKCRKAAELAEPATRPSVDRSDASDGEAAASAQRGGAAPLLSHQPRDKAVSCTGCGKPTWEFHARCAACGVSTCERCQSDDPFLRAR